jgi:integrase
MFVDRPTHRPKGIDPFTEKEMQSILEESATSPFQAVYELAFQCGPRQGEIFGALWEDFDLFRKVWSVKRQLIYSTGKHETSTPKTLSSIRKLELTDRVVAALRDRQRIAMREGNAGCPYVFCSSRGAMIWPGDFWVQHWKPLLQRCGIRHRGIHHTRHSFATMALGSGVPINVVSYMLGHSNVATTLKSYAHFLPSQQAQATVALAKIIG